jgi:hypothetical protein
MDYLHICGLLTEKWLIDRDSGLLIEISGLLTDIGGLLTEIGGLLAEIGGLLTRWHNLREMGTSWLA